MKAFNAIKEQVAALEADAIAFYEKGNKAAGTRLRNGLQQIKVLAQEARLDVSEKKNS